MAAVSDRMRAMELAKAEADKFTKQHNIEQESLVEDFGY